MFEDLENTLKDIICTIQIKYKMFEDLENTLKDIICTIQIKYKISFKKF